MSSPLREQLDQAGKAYRDLQYDGDLASELLATPLPVRRRTRWRAGMIGGVGLGMAAAIVVVVLLRGTGPGPGISNPNPPTDTLAGGDATVPPEASHTVQPPVTPTTTAAAQTTATPVVPPRINIDIRRFSLSRPSLATLNQRPDLSRSDGTPLRLTRPRYRPSAPRPAQTPSTPSDAPATGASRWLIDPPPVETS